MKALSMSLILVVGLLAIASNGHAAVEYVKICSLYGEGFHYIPGTDVCVNEETGDARQQTVGGTWRWLVPNSQGYWVSNPAQECKQGKLVKIGTFRPSDFTLNSHDKYQTTPSELTLDRGEFISKVLMMGGFYNPDQPLARTGQDGGRNALCLHSADPDYASIVGGNPPVNPYWCNGLRPLACVSPSTLRGMPATYSVPVSAAYPDVYYNTDSNGDVIGDPHTCGSELVLTTGGSYDPTMIGNPPGQPVHTAGTLSVWVCVEHSGHAGRFVPR
jgi:hypothetical protein